MSYLFFVLAAVAAPQGGWELVDFVAAALAYNTDAQEALARRQRDAGEVGSQRGKLLPGLHLEGSFTENQFQFAIPNAGRTYAIQQTHQLDGQVALKVPLLDLAQLARHGAARLSLQASEADVRHTRLEVGRQVAQAYYQLVADQALVEAAVNALTTAKGSLRLAEDRAAVGQSTRLEVTRARAQVATAERQRVDAEQEARLAARRLTTLSGLSPPAEALPRGTEDPLHPEPPLGDFSLPDARVPALRLAERARLGAERLLRAERMRWAPTLQGRFTERFSSATAYAMGHHSSYQGQLTLAWDLDFATSSTVHRVAADAQAARIRERRARLKQADDMFTAYTSVDALCARSRAARAEAAASAEAAALAEERYATGLATQLDLLQAQRDDFRAEAERILADTNLKNARIQLRLVAGMPPAGWPGAEEGGRDVR